MALDERKLTTRHLVERFKLNVLAGERGLERPITVSEIYRPGLAIAGYFAYHPVRRIQVIGKTEMSFAQDLSPEVRRYRFSKFMHEDTPCVIVAHGVNAPDDLVREAEAHGVPLLESNITTTKLISELTNFLEMELAPRTTMHGVLVEVYGIGILLTGTSGIGKSETALELIKRGHRLVADDAVEILQTSQGELIGEAPAIIENLLEIRGLGILNVMALFGAGAIRLRKKISLVVRLEYWDSRKNYDRLGLDEARIRVLDTDLPLVVIPVRPGRNLAVIVEVAAMHHRLKLMGYNAAQQFADRLDRALVRQVDEAYD
ncbi:MAG: HPr kinase/phosphorylase [Candidatus Carbobacillus altaicus]|uniref:HPr kinase/phosphorylase n=1 Tax=Candidatus Carbonibacillus altaicus TaxID=2163959 RepID=A0A2R6XZY4_9BACL|nr:MAG: HPr kinase/phosphorylase [Candidatus Carbobacillus altaicus]